MSQFELKMPKLGESVEEATITKWFVKVGDMVDDDQPLLEVATDKVDSEIPSPVSGRIVKINYPEGEKVPVGLIIAIIDLSGAALVLETGDIKPETGQKNQETEVRTQKISDLQASSNFKNSERFFSPLVRSIAKQENVSITELEGISGSGQGGRVNKKDILEYLQNKEAVPADIKTKQAPVTATAKETQKVAISVSAGDQIVEMDRMRKLIADHMVMSKQVSPHVTNFVEADVTNLVRWREKNKTDFEKKNGVKLTYMPAFIEATAKALRDFPGVNASVDGTKIILRKQVNIGIAVALPTGNLIVPVIKNADMLNQGGLATELNRLAESARINKLNPDDIQGGTFTITNFGSFRNLAGTPIINQPQVAILATGNIEKKPAVLELPSGDVIAIRHKMMLSLSYDHRVVDGVLGGSFLRRIADYLENWDQ